MVAMRIAQLVLPSASEYERKCARVDAAAFDVTTDPAAADVAHVYASGELAARDVGHLTLPWLASAALRRSRWPFGRVAGPRVVVSPIPEAGQELLPEAVDEAYFAPRQPPTANRQPAIGTFGPRRRGVRNMVEQTLARIHRFRDDVEWRLIDEIPSPATLAGVDLWVDPAIDFCDFDGFVAEALVVGLQVVASRTPINSFRLEKGRTGFLVPPSDPNEMTHAILAALFKPDVAAGRVQAARQTISKFRPRQRVRVLSKLYETLTR
jgi:hypothetical protein